MSAEKAMDNMVLRAVQLDLAKKFFKMYPSPDNYQYVKRMKEKYDVAFRAYTDPFGVKTHA